MATIWIVRGVYMCEGLKYVRAARVRVVVRVWVYMTPCVCVCVCVVVVPEPSDPSLTKPTLMPSERVCGSGSVCVVMW